MELYLQDSMHMYVAIFSLYNNNHTNTDEFREYSDICSRSQSRLFFNCKLVFVELTSISNKRFLFKFK